MQNNPYMLAYMDFFINFAAEFVGKVTELSMDGVGKVTFECIIQVRKVTYDKQAFR